MAQEKKDPIPQPTPVSNPPQPNQPQPIRPQHGEYMILCPSPNQNIRLPGQVQGMRYQIMNINQSNLLQAPQLIRSINASHLIRTSNSGVVQTSTSQAQTTTMTRHLQIPFSANGPRGQITLPNGQTIMPSAIPMQRHPMMQTRATILQQPLIRSQPLGVHQAVIPTSQPLGLGVQTSINQPTIIHQQATNIMNTTPTNTATPPSLMTPEEALAKGTSFFQTLLARVSNQKKKTVPNLIQSLIDGEKTSEEFATALQKETNSSHQPQLVPFLDLLLPHMKQALDAGTINLPGIRGPNQRNQQQQQQPQLLPITQQQQQESTTQLEATTSQTSSPNKVQSISGGPPPPKKKKIPLPPGQKSKYAIRKEQQEARKRERESLAAQGVIKIEPGTEQEKKSSQEKTEKPPAKPKSDKPRPKQKKPQLESLSSALRDDDDVNDVAAMGGVNLAEESQKIMASGAELVGTQIRSCKDEPFLDIKVLTKKVAKITKEYNLPEPSEDVVTLISHATQEKLKTMVERLGILAEHRSENLKIDGKYDISTDIKGQMKFLAELDRIEKRRYEEQERELLLRVAKSRSKVEDPEQQKLRQKAKDMQRAEQEEVRQREANETALLAIGPRKKLKASTTSSLGSPFSQSSSFKDSKTSIDVRGDTIRRLKRVNMRDLQILLELDRAHIDRLIKMTAQ